jgi:hypothetical protein
MAAFGAHELAYLCAGGRLRIRPDRVRSWGLAAL